MIRPRGYELACAPKRWSGRALLAHVSALYYLEGRTQDEIAAQLDLSRAKVSRLLCAARDTGMVRIFVRPPPGTFLSLETELEARFGVREVRIVPSSLDEPPEETRRRLGRAAAADLARSVKSGQTVGLVGMEFLGAMVDAVVPTLATGLCIVQGIGWENAPSPQRTLTDLVLDLARRIEGSAVVLPAPSVVESEHVRGSLAADPQISAALHALDDMDTLYTEVAPVAPSADRAPDAMMPVGQLARRHFDCQGRMLGSVVDGHVVGVTIDQLRRTRHVVALAHDPAQSHVIAAALCTRLVGTLIIDELTARAVAALPLPAPPRRDLQLEHDRVRSAPRPGENHDDDT